MRACEEKWGGGKPAEYQHTSSLELREETRRKNLAKPPPTPTKTFALPNLHGQHFAVNVQHILYGMYMESDRAISRYEAELTVQPNLHFIIIFLQKNYI